MNRSRILLASLGTLLYMATSGRAQDSVYIKPVDDKPMSLTSDDVKTTEKKTDESKPFWIFGEAAPLTSPIVTDRPGFSDSASLVARVLDQTKPEGILGTIAGDDTIFVAPRSTKKIDSTINAILEQFS